MKLLFLEDLWLGQIPWFRHFMYLWPSSGHGLCDTDKIQSYSIEKLGSYGRAKLDRFQVKWKNPKLSEYFHRVKTSHFLTLDWVTLNCTLSVSQCDTITQSESAVWRTHLKCLIHGISPEMKVFLLKKPISTPSSIFSPKPIKINWSVVFSRSLWLSFGSSHRFNSQHIFEMSLFFVKR